MRSLRFFSLLVPAAFLSAGASWGAIPSAAMSIVDPCLRICPAGDMTFHVDVRNANNNPRPGTEVVVDLCHCPAIVLCPPNGTEAYSISGCTVSMIANAEGVTDFHLRAGGTCNGAVRVLADALALRLFHSAASPDQNGDLVVNAADQAILAGKLGGPYDPTGDVNCGGTVDQVDANILAAHLAHSYAAAMPVRASSWGELKIVYR